MKLDVLPAVDDGVALIDWDAGAFADYLALAAVRLAVGAFALVRCERGSNPKNWRLKFRLTDRPANVRHRLARPASPHEQPTPYPNGTVLRTLEICRHGEM
jgi:hypothetical protein